MLLGWDIDVIDSKLNLNTTSPEAIECAKMYQTLMKNYAPPGVGGFNWNECQTLFMQGNAAMWYDGVGFAAPLEDPTKSRVVGKVGYEINFNRYFYRYTPPRALGEIESDIRAIEKDIIRMLGEVTGGR
jgi:ABC-type glycerol-3-phosphate transport system substrate-binding protein